MGIVFRQSAKNSIVVGIGALLGALIMWLSVKFIAKQELGSIGILTNFAITFSQILLLGLNNTMIVYIHRYANDVKKKKLLLGMCLSLPILFATLITIAYYYLKTPILNLFQQEDATIMAQYFMWLPIYTVLFIYLIILEQYLGSQMKVAISAFMREVVLRVLNIAVILLFALGYIDFNTLVKSSILIYLLPVTIMLVLARKIKDFGLSFHIKDFSKSEYKEMVQFSWYHFLLSASVLLIAYMDALLLPFYDHNGVRSVAVYRIPVFFISFLQLPLKALMPASFTVLAKAFAENDRAKAADLFLRSSNNIFIATVFIALILCCNLQNVVRVIPEGYSEIIPVFMILFIGQMVNIVTGMNDQVLSITNYYKFNFYLSLLLIGVLFLLIRILVPHYSIYGAAWSTTITIIIFNTAKCLFVWKKLQMLPFSKNTILVILAAVPALAVGYYFPHMFNPLRHVYVHAFSDAAIRSIAITIAYFLMLLWLKPSADLEEYLSSIKKNKRLF